MNLLYRRHLLSPVLHLQWPFLIAVIDDLIKNLFTLAGGIVSIYYLGDWVIPTIKSALSSKLDGGKNPDT